MLELKRRGKKGIFYIFGTLGGERIRQSTKTASEPHAQAKLAKLQCEILDRITFGEERTSTFDEAVELHLTKKEGTIQPYDAKFIKALSDKFGAWRIADITETEVSRWAKLTYPNCGPQGLDRQVYTPLIAVLTRAANAKMCAPPAFTRPEKPEREMVQPAREDELAALLPCCTDRLQACVLLMSFTAARASEACRLSDAAGDIDWDARKASLRKTKNGTPRVVPLPLLAYEALCKLKGSKGPIFGLKTRYSLNQALERACKRAKIRVMTSHEVGRHAFAARLLGQGYTLKQVQEAGGWKSYRMVAEIYGHLEKSAVHDAMRQSDTKLAQLMETGGNVVRIQAAKK